MPDNNERERDLERFREAVDRKSEEARARSESPGREPDRSFDPDAVTGEERSLTERGRPQDVYSVRDKNVGKGKKTADKWNQ
jgi:hypothetical protein